MAKFRAKKTARFLKGHPVYPLYKMNVVERETLRWAWSVPSDPACLSEELWDARAKRLVSPTMRLWRSAFLYNAPLDPRNFFERVRPTITLRGLDALWCRFIRRGLWEAIFDAGRRLDRIYKLVRVLGGTRYGD